MKTCDSSFFVVVALALLGSAVSGHAQSSMCAPVSNNPLVMESICNDQPKAEFVPAVLHSTSKSQPSAPLLALTAQEISGMALDDPQMIRPGDVLSFEANRGDFILHTYLSNGRMIVTQPMTKEEAGNTSLDYSETVNPYIVGFQLIPLHQTGAPLMLRGVKIYRNGKIMLELEKNHPGPEPAVPGPPMSYPPDPRLMTASLMTPSLLGREPQTGFLSASLPPFSVNLMFQSSTGTADPNHYKYTGKEFDAETGLYYYGARYYSPALGRFTSPDPKMMSGQRMLDPQQWNMYQYSRNNPTTYFDPDGKEVKTAATGKDHADLVKALGKAYMRTDFQKKFDQLKAVP